MLKKVKYVLSLIVVLTTLGVGIASADSTVNVQGGVWKYWKDSKYAYSEYYHPSRYHSSAVKVGNYTARSGITVPNEWAKASAENSWWHTEQFYYNVH